MGLAHRVHAVARVLHEGRARPDAAVRFEREARDVAAVVVRDEHEAAGLVEGDVARIATARRLLVQQREAGGSRINDVSAYSAGRPGVACVEVPPVRMDDEERRLHGLDGELRPGERARAGVEMRQ